LLHCHNNANTHTYLSLLVSSLLMASLQAPPAMASSKYAPLAPIASSACNRSCSSDCCSVAQAAAATLLLPLLRLLLGPAWLLLLLLPAAWLLLGPALLLLLGSLLCSANASASSFCRWGSSHACRHS
jgi:hypothetical protein